MSTNDTNDYRPHAPDAFRVDPGIFMLTIPQFCRRYSTCRTKAYDLLRTKELQRVKVGRATRILTESADAWARGLEAKGTIQ